MPEFDKEVLTFKEAKNYMGVSESTLYKLTYEKKIPHYKPNGGRVYFDKDELVAWLKRNRVASVDELETQAQTYCSERGGAA